MRSLRALGDLFLLLWAQLLVWGVLAVFFFSLYFAAASSRGSPMSHGELGTFEAAFWIVYVGTIGLAAGVGWFGARSMGSPRLGIAAIMGGLVVAGLLSFWLLHALSFMNECALGVSYPLASGDCGR